MAADYGGQASLIDLVKWRAKKGVWKATFEIFDDETPKEPPKETQIKYFDLRNANGNGFAIILT